MPNVVLDANVLVSAALKPRSMPDEALFFASAYDEICVSSDVAGEFGKVLGRGRFASRVGFSERARAVSALMERAIEFTPRERIRDCRDPKDDKYLELALEAGLGDRQRRPRPAGARSMARRAHPDAPPNTSGW